MGQLFVNKDPIRKIRDTIMPLYYPGRDETSDPNILERNKTGVQQTKMYGILSPLIQVNGVIIDFPDVLTMSLRSTGVVPECSMSIRDRYGLLEMLAAPGADNDMTIQILPPFENAYKKIKLLFYITSYRQSGEYVVLTCAYKCPELTSTRFISLGQKSTWDLFQWASNQSGLGLTSNTEASDADKRWMYCCNKSIMDILREQCAMGGDGSGRVIYDWWIDLWDYINLCNIYERWTTKDSEDQMQVWTTGQLREVDPEVPIEPLQATALLSNLYTLRNTELYVLDYKINNTTGSGMSKGTDKCYGTWLDSIGGWSDSLIQDGDVKADIFVHHEYLGEVFGEDGYNYMLAPLLRDAFLQKMNSQTIEVTLQSPCLGLARGGQCLFEWYVNDTNYEMDRNALEEGGSIEAMPRSEAETGSEGSMGRWIRNDRVSGQYLITGQVIEYEQTEGGLWKYKLTLTRPQSDAPVILNKAGTGAE